MIPVIWWPLLRRDRDWGPVRWYEWFLLVPVIVTLLFAMAVNLYLMFQIACEIYRGW